MYAGNTNQDTDPNYKDYAINLNALMKKNNIISDCQNVELGLEPIN